MKYDLFIDAEGALADHFRFLGKSVSDDETRYFMMNIFVEPIDAEKPEAGLRGVATDGRRMHIVEPINEAGRAVFDMRPGFYRFLRGIGKRVWVARISDECKDQTGTFPNWRRVMPEGEPKHVSDFPGFSLSRDHHNSTELVKMLREFPEPTSFNLNYLADLGMWESWVVRWWAPNKAVEFVSGVKKAVIMPMAMDQ